MCIKQFVIMSVSLAAIFLACIANRCQSEESENTRSSSQNSSNNSLSKLVDYSKKGKSITECPIPDVFPADMDAVTAKKYILENPDSSVYHLMLTLRQLDKSEYDTIPDEIKTQILCRSMVNTYYLNDWGILTLTQSSDGDSAKALLEIKKVALPHLILLLDDKREALHYGSEAATASKKYKYRRADFAYRYIMLILEQKPTFPETPQERDVLIKALKKELSTQF